MNNFFKPVILGISGFYVSKKEYFLFRKHKPIGYVIFTRNIANLTQLKNLVSELRSINPEQKTLIMIDHEGGRVNRFHNLFDQSHYSAKISGNYYQTNKKLFSKEIKKFINFNCNLFKYLGINLVGFIPGCGPQIMITSMYIAGHIPLAAQIGNSISNDGDALFPAIAISPKAAILATLYSAIPAVLVAYVWYYFIEFSF